MLQEESRIRDHKGGRNYRCAAIMHTSALFLPGTGCELGALGVLAHLGMYPRKSWICQPARVLTHGVSFGLQ